MGITHHPLLHHQAPGCQKSRGQGCSRGVPQDFDIKKFLGENMLLACLCLKAVATSLGSDNLPTNVIRKLLEGFAKSATVSFIKLCTSQSAHCHGSISQKLFMDTSLYTQLVDVLNNLDSVYLDLVGGKL